MTVFALVHGGQHGAWCWTYVIPELERRRHSAVAVDLPIEDVRVGAAGYAAVVAESLRDAGDDVVLVGHSLGGLTIPLLPGLRPVRRLIFVSAGLPEPGRSYVESLAMDGAELLGPDAQAVVDGGGPDVHLSPPEIARATFYHDVSPDLQAWAIARLRPQSRTPHRERTPLRAWPETPRSVVHAADDRAIPLALARRRAGRIVAEDVVVIPGGHSPFLSRPGELAELLVQLAGPA